MSASGTPTGMTGSVGMLPRTLSNLTEQDARHVLWQTELKNEDWSFVQSCMTRLFQLRKYPDLANDLPILNDKISKLSKSSISPFLNEFYQDQLLMKCMIILRQDIKEESGDILLSKLAKTWSQFYTSILPTLQAFFSTIQLKSLSIRQLTLLSFRNIVVLKTSISDALDNTSDVSKEIKQMLLVLQSVRESPLSDQYFELQSLVAKVIHPYVCLAPKAPPSSGSVMIKRHCSLGGEKDKRYVKLIGEDLKMSTE